MKPATKRVILKKGAKFNALIHNPKGKPIRKQYIGPCEVMMTEAQIKAFDDHLQKAPEVTVVKEASEDESEDKPDSTGGSPEVKPETPQKR